MLQLFFLLLSLHGIALAMLLAVLSKFLFKVFLTMLLPSFARVRSVAKGRFPSLPICEQLEQHQPFFVWRCPSKIISCSADQPALYVDFLFVNGVKTITSVCLYVHCGVCYVKPNKSLLRSNINLWLLHTPRVTLILLAHCIVESWHHESADKNQLTILLSLVRIDRMRKKLYMDFFYHWLQF